MEQLEFKLEKLNLFGKPIETIQLDGKYQLFIGDKRYFITKNIHERIETPTIEDIKEEIQYLNTLLKKMEVEKQFELIDDKNLETSGFYKTGLSKKILDLLNDGKKLKVVHEYFGEADVEMNPQCNSILVKGNKDINEDSIYNFMLRASCKWFINNKK